MLATTDQVALTSNPQSVSLNIVTVEMPVISRKALTLIWLLVLGMNNVEANSGGT